jgi:hypothetical protein
MEGLFRSVTTENFTVAPAAVLVVGSRTETGLPLLGEIARSSSRSGLEFFLATTVDGA